MTINFTTTVAELKTAFKTLQPAMSKEETRFYLNGICFEKIGNEVNFIATDGHKLICIDVLKNDYFSVLSSEMEKDFNFIIPRGAIEEFLAADKVKCENICISFTVDKVTFEYDNGEVIKVYRLIDGTFPDWRKVIPKNTKGYVSFNPKYLEQFCKNLSAMDTVRLECDPDEKTGDGSVQPQLIKTSMGALLVLMPVRF